MFRHLEVLRAKADNRRRRQLGLNPVVPYNPCEQEIAQISNLKVSMPNRGSGGLNLLLLRRIASLKEFEAL